MAKNHKHTRQFETSQMNSAMEEFFSRGGRIKKIKKSTNQKFQQKDFASDDDFFADFSPIEISCDLPIRKPRKFED